MDDPAVHALVERSVAGDEDATRQLLNVWYPKVWTVCRRMLGNAADAEDVTQETLVKVVRGLGTFRQQSTYATWIYAIATNTSRDELRRRRRRVRTVSLDGRRTTDPPRSIADPSASDAFDAVTDGDAFDAALATLNDEFRAPLILRDVAGLSYRDIATQLDISVGTVKSRIARARRAMLTELSGDGNRDADVDVQQQQPPHQP